MLVHRTCTMFMIPTYKLIPNLAKLIFTYNTKQIQNNNHPGWVGNMLNKTAFVFCGLSVNILQ